MKNGEFSEEEILHKQRKEKKEKTSGWRKEAVGLTVMVVIALILAFGLSWGLQIYLATDTPQVAVTTGSMEPVYHGYESSGKLNGDLLIVKSFSAREYKAGDVIVFDAPGQSIPIVHRIIAIYKDPGDNTRYFKTMGDHNRYPDTWLDPNRSDPEKGIFDIPDHLGNGWIHEDAIHGRVILRIPNIGWLALQLHEDYMRILIIIIALLLLLWGFFDSEDEDKEEESSKPLVGDKSVVEDAGTAEDSENGEIIQSKLKTRVANDSESNQNSSPQGNAIKRLEKLVSARNIIVLVIILVILGYAVVQAVFAFNETRVELLDLPDEITLTADGTPVDSARVRPVNRDAGLYFIACQLRIHSRGLFNYINEVGIALEHVNGTKLEIYRWTIIYGFNGAKTAGAGLVLPLNSRMFGSYTILVTGYTAGILAGSDAAAAYSLSIVTT
ncbi:MAG: signal peptidase I [Candidatus Hodarchaeota archaeon]